MRAPLVLLAVLSAVLAWSSPPCLADQAAAEPDRYVYPRGATEDDPRNVFERALLTAALEATRADYGPFELTVTDKLYRTNSQRQLALMKGEITVLNQVTNPRLEVHMLPVRIPVTKGLLGYRTFIIRAEDADRFAAVKDLADLRAFTAGQGFDWEDVAVLDHAGLPVERVNSYMGLFDLLAKGRFDYFPRGVFETVAEMRTFGDEFPSLAAEKTLCLQYPFAVYYFFRLGDVDKAGRVEAGLKALKASGRFDALFQEHFGPVLEEARLQERTILRLENPDLPERFPLDVEGYWLGL